MYKLDYLQSHDIDWFASINGIPVHFASDGGRLPGNSYTIEELTTLQHLVASSEKSYHCVVNRDYLDNYLRRGEHYKGIENIAEDNFRRLLPEEFVIDDDIMNLPRQILIYGWSFIEMARRGFYSFDRSRHDNGVDYYHLVARPINSGNRLFPDEIYERLACYYACCFPPCHDEGYSLKLPQYMKIDVRSCLCKHPIAF